MTDHPSPLPAPTPGDIVEVVGLVRRLTDTFGKGPAEAAAVVVLMDRHGITRQEAADRVVVAMTAFSAARVRVMRERLALSPHAPEGLRRTAA